MRASHENNRPIARNVKCPSWPYLTKENVDYRLPQCQGGIVKEVPIFRELHWLLLESSQRQQASVPKISTILRGPYLVHKFHCQASKGNPRLSPAAYQSSCIDIHRRNE